MRIIKEKTLFELCRKDKYRLASEAIKAWVFEVKKAEWNSPNDLKSKYLNASVISSKRVVFNIKGNDYRLIVDIEYKLKIIFITWFGSHSEYNQINVKTVSYDNKSY